MSRRRRLALRQIEEPPPLVEALSDLEDESVVVEGPSFSLLPTLQLPIANSDAAPALQADRNGRNGHAPTQVVASSSTDELHGAALKKPRLETGAEEQAEREEEAARAEAGVFQLYQPGLCADHTLRLHFIRRRPPPPPPTRIEDEFILPRPPLVLRDLLPPDSVTLDDLLRPSQEDEGVAPQQPTHQELGEASASAKTHWRTLGSAPSDSTLTWRVLKECDWHAVFSASGSFVPPLDAIVQLLRSLRSSAFASFVWAVLLVPLLTQAHCSGQRSLVEPLAAALLPHDAFRLLPAKAFRAQLRSKRLRAIDEAFGAHAELALATHFYKLRNSDV